MRKDVKAAQQAFPNDIHDLYTYTNVYSTGQAVVSTLLVANHRVNRLAAGSPA